MSRASSHSPEVWVVMMAKDAEVRWFLGTVEGPFSQEALLVPTLEVRDLLRKKMVPKILMFSLIAPQI